MKFGYIFHLFCFSVLLVVVMFAGVIPASGQGKVYEGLNIREYKWSMAAFNYPRTPGSDSVYIGQYQEVWYFNIDSLCYHMATNPNNYYTRSLMHYHFWSLISYFSEKQIKENYNKMKAAAKKYNYIYFNDDADYWKICMLFYSSLNSKDSIIVEDVEEVLEKIQEYNKRFQPKDKARLLVSLCGSYRISRLLNHHDRSFRHVPAILKLQEEVPIKDNPDYYYLYYFIGSDYLRFGAKELGVYYLKKALHNEPMRFSDRSDLRARSDLAEYYGSINQLDSSDYYYRSLYDSRQMVRFRPIYDIVAAVGIACNLVKRGNYAEALPLLESWLPEAKRMKVVKLLFYIYVFSGKCYFAEKQYEQAKAMIDSLQELIRNPPKVDILTEFLPQYSLPVEDLYELLFHYYSHIGDKKLAKEYLDSMRMEGKRHMEKHTPLIILQAEREFFKDESSLIAKQTDKYKMNIYLLIFIVVLVLILLSITVYFYKKKHKAYYELLEERKNWAKQMTLEMVNTDDKSNLARRMHEFTEDESNLVQQVHELMNDGLFRDCELTLESLANKLSVHRNTLSRAINHVTGKNFNRFVNEYRIKEAIRVIENIPQVNKNLYIDGLYQELGFNSPASFFRAFKNVTDFSPVAFFRQIEDNQ